MTAVTMRADQVQPGDTIAIGGHMVKMAKRVSYAPFLQPAPTFDPRLFYFAVEREALVTVERPDPDAELIEVMAKNLCEGWEGDDWNDLVEFTRGLWRSTVRAALAAAREAGLLPEVTP